MLDSVIGSAPVFALRFVVCNHLLFQQLVALRPEDMAGNLVGRKLV